MILESTTYPGTTRDELGPVLERSGMVAGSFHLAFSAERVDPGRVDDDAHDAKGRRRPTPECTRRAMGLRDRMRQPGPGRHPQVAEMTGKLLENIFRSVNIALVNELAMLCDRMNIDVWDVIDAAATKPFGFMPFRPGPVWVATSQSIRST